MATIENVLSGKELESRFNKLCKANWKVKHLSKVMPADNIKDIINNWFPSSRPHLLELLKIKENKNHKYVYHNL